MRTVMLMMAALAMAVGSATAEVILDENWNLTARAPQWGVASVDTTEFYSGANSLKLVPTGDGGQGESGIGVWLPLDVSIATDGLDPTTKMLRFRYKIDPTGVNVPAGQTYGNVNFNFRLESQVWGQFSGGTYIQTPYITMLADGQWNEATFVFTGWQTQPPVGGNITSMRIYRDWYSGAGVAHQPSVWFDLIEVVDAPVSLIPGDANKNGYVDDDDLSLLLANWNQNGTTWETGDFNDTGYVDDDDLSLLLANWNQGTPPAGDIVPEPASLSLIGLGALAIIRRRRAA